MTRRRSVWPKPRVLNDLPTPVLRRPVALARLLGRLTIARLPTDEPAALPVGAEATS